MDCMIFIILTDEHKGLNEGLTISKYMQIKHKVSLLTYDLSHYRSLPLLESDVNKIKDLINSMSNHYDSVKVNIVADDLQIDSVKESFSDTNYDITAYVMNNVIRFNN